MACIPSRKIKISEASVLDLKQIPGLRDEVAEKILQYRDQHGPIKDFSDFRNVPGVNDETIEAMRDCLIVI